MGYKNVNGLMRHLRSCGINISGSKEKRQLINTGYYHGYKGYRFFKNSNNRIPFSSFSELYATIQYDTKLKTLFYDKLMFIETAVKNISLMCILDLTGSERIESMFENVICGYKNAPQHLSDSVKKEIQFNKLKLEKTIRNAILDAYKDGDSIITHFYHSANHNGVPLWALFEILTLGNFGYLLSGLTYGARDYISKELGFNLAYDTGRQLVYRYIFTLRDLRNAVAHNDVIFDARFNTSRPSRAMTQCLCAEIGLQYVNFKTIGDYVILVCYYLKLLKVPKSEIRAFVKEYEKIVSEYQRKVAPHVANMVIHPDTYARINILKNYLKN